MSRLQIGIAGILLVAGIGLTVLVQHYSQAELREENESLRRDAAEMKRLAAENQRLSNVVAQARVALANTDGQLQELLKLRSEVSRLNHERDESNRVNQAKSAQSADDEAREFSALRNEMTGLRQEIGGLRDDIRQFQTAATPPAAPVERTTPQANTQEEQPVSIRMIDTHAITFAEKLRRSVAAQEGETFQDVFGRFLQSHGIDVTSVAGAVFDERTGRVIVRAPAATLDQIERVTVALDRAQ
jgi:predicted  nucleic acid-binding Zn-ribbon protein